MKGLDEEIKTFGDALENQGNFSVENPEYKGDISFRHIQIAGGYLKGSGKLCEGCKYLLRNVQGEIALILITHGRIIPIKEIKRDGGIAIEDIYVVCGESCNEIVTPDDYIPDEQRGLPLVDFQNLLECKKRMSIS